MCSTCADIFHESFGAQQHHSVMWLIHSLDLIATFQNTIHWVSVLTAAAAVAGLFFTTIRFNYNGLTALGPVNLQSEMNKKRLNDKS